MRVLIYTGGTVYTDEVREMPEAGDYVICADAGYETAKKLGVKPDFCIGDFDTLGAPPKEVDPDAICVLPKEKNYTDTEAAVDKALSLGAVQLVIVGGLEGRLDHTLATVNELITLSSDKKRPLQITLTNGKNRVRLLENSGAILVRGEYTYFSLIVLSEKAKVSLEGCKYPLRNKVLTNLRQWAVSNEIEGNCALVEVHRGRVLLIECNE